eukprot:9587255-Lingulodinium_polyedra.AAC.1
MAHCLVRGRGGLSPDNKKKVMAFYASFRELGHALRHEEYWFPLGALRRHVANAVQGKWSRVVAALLQP